jgi:formylglycine-generating enzyme required for sulfatase activity
VFTREQLAQAARRRLEADSATEARRSSRRRVPRWRIGLWVVECIVLLALLEAFVLRPMMARRQASRRETPVLPVALPVAVVPLGGEARLLPGLKEVVPTFLAPLEGLAVGSETMRSAQQSFSATARLPVEVENSIGMRFRLIPPGTALLGSPPQEAGRGDRELQHVFVAPLPFYLGTVEVTQAEWGRVMPTDPSHYQGARRPVEEVTWYDCQEFLSALCRLEGVAAGTYRLPSESEWEYACRAGTSTAYCCGNDPRHLDAFATHGENGGSGTTEVGLMSPNGLGLYDLHGNVWEWCLNRFAPYAHDERPADPEYESWRCLRGGNWYVPPGDCRSAARNRLPPASTGNMLGFRVLRVIATADEASSPPSPPLEGEAPQARPRR